VIRRVAAERGAALHFTPDLLTPGPADGLSMVDTDNLPTGRVIDVTLAGEEGTPLQAYVPLLGGHQVTNAHTAAAALALLHQHGPERLRRLTTPELIAALTIGFARVEWPGRLEIVGRDPLVVLDGAHNGESAQRLREALTEDFGVQGRAVVYVLGVNQGHNAADILRELAPLAVHAVFTPIRSARSTLAADLAALWAPTGAPYSLAESVPAALAEAQDRVAALGARLVCATGSLYLVGEAREAFGRSTGHDPL